MAGYIIVPRDLFTDKTFRQGKANETFAFLDLVQMAEYRDREVNIKGQMFTLHRGELAASVRFLADRWGWSVNTTSHALDTLERYNKLIRRKSNVTSIISIVNYEQYQQIPNAECDTNRYANCDADCDKTKDIKDIKTEKKKIDTKVSKEKESGAVDRIYALYPTNCPMRGASTGKSSKCKVKISSLLKTHTEEELSYVVSRYVKENLNKHYLQNFSTFLNNLPDYSDMSDPGTLPGFAEDSFRVEGRTYHKMDFVKSKRMDEYFALDGDLQKKLDSGNSVIYKNGKFQLYY